MTRITHTMAGFAPRVRPRANGTSSSTGAPVCADDLCNGDCCADGDICVEEQCQKDCGGPPPCGPQQDCCGAQELCYLGECVQPGPACDVTQCATQLTNDCAQGFVCPTRVKPAVSAESARILCVSARTSRINGWLWVDLDSAARARGCNQ